MKSCAVNSHTHAHIRRKRHGSLWNRTRFFSRHWVQRSETEREFCCDSYTDVGACFHRVITVQSMFNVNQSVLTFRYNHSSTRRPLEESQRELRSLYTEEMQILVPRVNYTAHYLSKDVRYKILKETVPQKKSKMHVIPLETRLCFGLRCRVLDDTQLVVLKDPPKKVHLKNSAATSPS